MTLVVSDCLHLDFDFVGVELGYSGNPVEGFDAAETVSGCFVCLSNFPVYLD